MLNAPASSFTPLANPEPSLADWVLPNTIKETVTAENVIEIINIAAGTTRTITQIDEQAPLLTSMNSDGTVTRNVMYFLEGEPFSTNVAFPTALEVIPETWVWNGVLSTLDAYGASACVTAAASTISVNVTSPPRKTIMAIAEGEDPRGWNYNWEDIGLSKLDLEVAGVANEDAFVCNYVAVEGIGNDILDRMMVATTSTAYESGSG